MELDYHSQVLEPGYHFSHIKIMRVIGQGGFGIVYLAFDLIREQYVAVKEYIPKAISNRGKSGEVTPRNALFSSIFSAGMDFFYQEAAILDKLSHPYIPKLLSFWQGNGTAYITMSFYEGKTLKECYVENPGIVTESWLITLLTSILNIVDLIHTQGVLHRDISWDNIQIQHGGGPVLLDFGSACFLSGTCFKQPHLVLKPGFSPVELYYNSGVLNSGPWSDIYSIGALVYTLITGGLPPMSLARSIDDTYNSLVGYPLIGYSQQFLHAIDCALAVNAADRPQTITIFSRLLNIDLAQTRRGSVALTTISQQKWHC